MKTNFIIISSILTGLLSQFVGAAESIADLAAAKRAAALRLEFKVEGRRGTGNGLSKQDEAEKLSGPMIELKKNYRGRAPLTFKPRTDPDL